MSFQPRLFIGIGKYEHFYTLRETCLRYGRGEILNGRFTGEVTETSFWHCNLSQNAEEAIEKAKQYAEEMQIPLYIGDSIEGTLLEINRADKSTAEGRAAFEEQKRKERQEYYQQIDMERIECLLEGRITFGKLAGMTLDQIQEDYARWVVSAAMQGKFSASGAMQAMACILAFKQPELMMPEFVQGFVGAEGARFEETVKIIKVCGFDTLYGRMYITSMKNEEGKCIVCKSAAFCPTVGDTFKIKATVKEFSEYKGQDQTIVQRIKVIINDVDAEKVL